MRTLSPEMKITLKTACSVIGAGIVGVTALSAWLNKKFDAQSVATKEQSTATQQLQADVSHIRSMTERCWTLDHQQVWTDLYNERNQAGKIPTPSEVAARVRTTPQVH